MWTLLCCLECNTPNLNNYSNCVCVSVRRGWQDVCIMLPWRYRTAGNSTERRLIHAHTHAHAHTRTPHAKWNYNVSDCSVNFAHCVKNNRQSYFRFRCVCVCVWLRGVLSVYRSRSEGRSVSLTWQQRVGGRGCKRCRRRSPGECRPERTRDTESGTVTAETDQDAGAAHIQIRTEHAHRSSAAAESCSASRLRSHLVLLNASPW